mmetsp:Transcript_14396/g.42331  ORF Transcript_14396/g.42331 Transcript_14396/m.42331 type:complete len:253 (-) Transcript_14396:951-1709(-)
MVLPVSGSSFLAGEPMRPMSPTCAWPQLLGQPVQCMRTRRGSSSCASRASATRTALCFVSTMPWPQNSEPVQATRPRMRLLACSTRSLAPTSAGSSSSAFTSPSATFGRMKFCSTVMRTSPSEYLSARSATWRASSAEKRPTGTVMPTHDLPSCFCLCTPMMSRLWYSSSRGGAALTMCPETPRLCMAASTCSRIQSSPCASRSHIIRVFWRSWRSPLSRKTSRTDSQKVTTSSSGTHASNGTDSAARLMEK